MAHICPLLVSGRDRYAVAGTSSSDDDDTLCTTSSAVHYDSCKHSVVLDGSRSDGRLHV